jgi:pilus assembly protein CpaF
MIAGGPVAGDLGLAELADAVHARLIAEGAPLDGAGDESRAAVADLVRGDAPLLGPGAVARVVQMVLDHATGLGALEPWLADPLVTDVMVNGGGRVWLDESTVLHLIERIVAPLGLHVDRASPLVDARLGDGSRVHVVVRPLAVDGPCLTIRRFGAKPIRLEEVADPGVAALLGWAVRARANIVVSGGAGAGKTTLLNALASGIATGERVVTIEDAAELRLPGEHVVRLEARPANAEGIGEVRIRDLVRASLRMRPDRIIVGEVRSGEALDMLQAMNTGHEGSLSTCHANSPTDALRRLETMVLMGDVDVPHAVVREQIASAVDLIVQIARTAPGVRRVADVAEVGSIDERGGLSARSLLGDGQLVALPRRPVRRVEAGPPDVTWLSR